MGKRGGEKGINYMAKVSDHFINLSFYLKYIPKMRLSFNVFTVENFRLIDEKYNFEYECFCFI
jgi:hypothetical protein